MLCITCSMHLYSALTECLNTFTEKSLFLDLIESLLKSQSVFGISKTNNNNISGASSIEHEKITFFSFIRRWILYSHNTRGHKKTYVFISRGWWTSYQISPECITGSSCKMNSRWRFVGISFITFSRQGDGRERNFHCKCLFW